MRLLLVRSGMYLESSVNSFYRVLILLFLSLFFSFYFPFFCIFVYVYSAVCV